MIFLKLLLSPLLIAVMSLVGQRFGHKAAGLLAGFPFVAGPIFIVFVFEQGPVFGEKAGFAALNGVVCLAVFCLVYAWLSRRHGWLVSLLASWSCFALAVALMVHVPVEPLLALVCAFAVPVGAPLLFPPLEQPAANGALGGVELATRMLAAALLVLSLTGLAAVTGPTLAGVLTPFPVASSVLAVFAHRKNGASAAVESLRGVIGGLYSFVSFFAIAAFVLPRAGGAIAIGSGIAAAVMVQTVVFIFSHRGPRRICQIA